MALLDALPGVLGSFDGYAMSLTNTPVKVAAASLTRTRVMLRNSSLDEILVGSQTTVNGDSGFILPPGETLTITAAGDVWARARNGNLNPTALSVWIEK